jgi:hypothetical protein
MSPRRRRAHTPPLLEALIQALEQQEFHNARKAAGALRAFGELASLEVPGRGAFAADHPELFSESKRSPTHTLGLAARGRNSPEAPSD